MYSRTVAIIGGFLVLASGAGELYRRKPRSRSLQSTGQVFLGIYLICVVGWGCAGCRVLVGSELETQALQCTGMWVAQGLAPSYRAPDT